VLLAANIVLLLLLLEAAEDRVLLKIILLLLKLLVLLLRRDAQKYKIAAQSLLLRLPFVNNSGSTAHVIKSKKKEAEIKEVILPAFD
jgi:hypothetical protein